MIETDRTVHSNILTHTETYIDQFRLFFPDFISRYCSTPQKAHVMAYSHMKEQQQQDDDED